MQQVAGYVGVKNCGIGNNLYHVCCECVCVCVRVACDLSVYVA